MSMLTECKYSVNWMPQENSKKMGSAKKVQRGNGKLSNSVEVYSDGSEQRKKCSALKYEFCLINFETKLLMLMMPLSHILRYSQFITIFYIYNVVIISINSNNLSQFHDGIEGLPYMYSICVDGFDGILKKFLIFFLSLCQFRIHMYSHTHTQIPTKLLSIHPSSSSNGFSSSDKFEARKKRYNRNAEKS